MRKLTSDFTDKLRFSGHLLFYVRVKQASTSNDNYISSFISSLEGHERLLEKKAGVYVFEKGAISLLNFPSFENNLVALSFNFRDSTQHFLDSLFELSTEESGSCNMTISFKLDRGVEEIRNTLRKAGKSFREAHEGNFSADMQISGQSVRVSVYTSASILTLEGILNRWSGRPSNLLETVLGGKRSALDWRGRLGKRPFEEVNSFK